MKIFRADFFIDEVKLIYSYRALVKFLVSRDLKVVYRQTFLGPIWLIIQPFINSAVFAFLLTSVGKLDTAQTNPILYILPSMIVWQYFSGIFLKTSRFYVDNMQILSKVYFPRFVVPLSFVFSQGITTVIQVLCFILVMVIFGGQIKSSYSFMNLLHFSIAIINITFFALAFGLLINTLSIRYRDLRYSVEYSIQLLMLVCPVVYSLKDVPAHFTSWYLLNPLAVPFEALRNAFHGAIESNDLLFSFAMSLLLFLGSYYFFQYRDKNFIDSI